MVIGCGNLLRGDDGIGIHALRKLAELPLSKEIRLMDAGTRSLDMLFQMEGADKAVIVDAVQGGLEPGTIYRLTKEDLGHWDGNFVSLHELKLEHILRMGEEILGERFARQIVIFGVEAGDVKEGMELSPKVKRALPRLVDLVLKEL